MLGAASRMWPPVPLRRAGESGLSGLSRPKKNRQSDGKERASKRLPPHEELTKNHAFLVQPTGGSAIIEDRGQGKYGALWQQVLHTLSGPCQGRSRRCMTWVSTTARSIH